jgi:N-acetylmuramoyl-L-alanine amidase
VRRAALAIATLIAAAPVAARAQIIVIDPGHGGTDPGGVGTGLEEKDVVLDTSQRFKTLLEADTADGAGGGAWTVHLTRDDDTFVSLAARASYANSLGADRFMSIHSNAFGDPSANGTETFAYAEGGTGAALRNLVQEEMIAAWGLRDRGNKTADFYVLRETAMPAVLHELAFITNVTDAAFLADPAQRQRAAEAHLYAIQRHYGITPYLPGSPGPDPDPDPGPDPEPDAGAPDAPPDDPADDADGDDDPSADDGSLAGGCSIAGYRSSRGPSGGSALALLLLLAAARRVRQRSNRRKIAPSPATSSPQGIRVPRRTNGLPMSSVTR